MSFNVFHRFLFQRVLTAIYEFNCISTISFQRISTCYFNEFGGLKTLKYAKTFQRISTIFKLQGSLM